MVEPLSRLLPVRWRDSGGPDQVKPTSRLKCPSLRLSTPPPAQCTMNASRMMARITTTTQKKNTMMPGIAYPATVLDLATAASYPPLPELFSPCLPARAPRGIASMPSAGDHEAMRGTARRCARPTEGERPAAGLRAIVLARARWLGLACP